MNTYGWLMVMYDRNQYNVVKQLSSNQKYINFKKENLELTVIGSGVGYVFAPRVSLEVTPKIASKLLLMQYNLVLLTKYRLMIVKGD